MNPRTLIAGDASSPVILHVPHASRVIPPEIRSSLTVTDDQLAAELDEITDALGGTPVDSEVLGWDDLRALAREGVAFGAHTRTHPLMGRLPVDRAIREALESRDDLVDFYKRVRGFPDG